MNIEKELSTILQSHIGGAFLFIGSGFSRRYLGLEDWEGLLEKFCKTKYPFTYYKTSANGNLAKAAELLANDFHDEWWNNDAYLENRNKYSTFTKDKTSALRIEISHYLKNLKKNIIEDYSKELDALKNLNVDGIITTNWDTFLEQQFSDYKVYIGQQELLFSNPQEVGEIYKIHGCSSDPNSLVLTESDYKKFEERNAYLASKLITIFMEHPIIFIGYSLNDQNIRSLLTSIVKCIDGNNLDKLRKNLIFINRQKDGGTDILTESEIYIEQVSLPITQIKTNNFSLVYNSIHNMKRKLPARILRHFKEQFYEFVYTSKPTKHILVSGIDDIKDHKNIDFVVGVGVKQVFSEQGYSVIKVNDLIDDLLFGKRNFNAEKVLNTVLVALSRRSDKYVPIHYYLHKYNIKTEQDYINYIRQENLEVINKFICKDINTLRIKNYKKQFERLPEKSLSYIIKNTEPEKAMIFILFLDKGDINLEELRQFLIQCKSDPTTRENMYSTVFRKLIVLYDKYKWGW